MKNKYNALVALLVLICLADAGYRIYKVYERLKNQQEEVHGLAK
jgi:hypothetical protein